jgi:hypothetical protein
MVPYGQSHDYLRHYPNHNFLNTYRIVNLKTCTDASRPGAYGEGTAFTYSFRAFSAHLLKVLTLYEPFEVRDFFICQSMHN